MPPLAWAYLIGCNVLAGSSFAAMTFVLRGFTPASAVFWRLFLGAVILLAGLRRKDGEAPVSGADRLRILAAGLFGLALPMTLGTMGLARSTATNAALLMGFEPAALFVVGAILYGERLTALKVAAIAAGLLGSSLIVLQGPPWNASLRGHWEGDLLLSLAAVSWAVYALIGKSVMKRVRPAVFTTATTAVAILPMALLAGSSIVPAAVPPREALLGLAFQAVGITYGATLMWNKGLELVPASTMAQFIFLQPLVGVVLGLLLKGDPLTVPSAWGGLLIILGMILAARKA